MSSSRSFPASNMRHSGAPNGWTEFSQGVKGIKDEIKVDPFPTISDAASSGLNHSKPHTIVARYVNESKGNTANGDISKQEAASAAKLLKDRHSWADDSLIEDILGAVNNDIDRASAILRSMVSPHSKIGEASTFSEVSSKDDQIDCSAGKNSLRQDNPNSQDEILMPVTVILPPMEPEWEEVDDIYVIHRKEAVKMMRAASQHSRAAKNALLQGDHSSAHQLAQMAHEERATAEKMNAKAADEILRIRNMNNDIRELDLHGLHSSEAVIALQRRLQKLEFGAIVDRSASVDGLSTKGSGLSRSPSSGSIASSSAKSSSDTVALARRNRGLLRVITGIGKHSKGEARLPPEVRRFLLDNGYRFEEGRPGQFDVYYKLRQG